MNASDEHPPRHPPPVYPDRHTRHHRSDYTMPRSLRRKPVPLSREKNPPIRFRFGGLLSAGRKDQYFGLRRRTCLIICIAIVLAVLALIVGLAVGLTRPKSQNLPLPSSSEHFTGDLTYYSPALGACGITSSDSEAVCAVSHLLFDAVQTGTDPNANPLCGMKIRARRYKEGVGERSEDLTVVDRCVGCAATDIDVSPDSFGKLADPDLGRVPVTWAWLNPVPTGAS